MLHPIGQRDIIRGLDIYDCLRHTLHGASLSGIRVGSGLRAQGSGKNAGRVVEILLEP
jgi:hypothetical protein